MSRKTVWRTGSTCPAMTYLVLKLAIILLFFTGIAHMLHYVYNMNLTQRIKRTISNENETGNSCEDDKQLIAKLKSELSKKTSSLRDNAVLIENLQIKLNAFNATNNQFKVTLHNLTDVLRTTRQPFKLQHNGKMNEMSISKPTSSQTMPYPNGFKSNVERVNRPCCIALKRMTDILRQYMEKTQDLKEEIKLYQEFNTTENIASAKSSNFKKRIELYNCTRRFYRENINWTIKSSKHSIYQSYKKGFFYESPILNRDIPKQKFKSKTNHRTLDFNMMAKVALSEVARESKLPKKLFEIDEALIQYDELAGAEYKLTYKFNNTRVFLVNLIKPFGAHFVHKKIVEHQTHEKELINIIVPISGRTLQLTNFLNDISNAVTKYKENIFLTFVIYGKDPKNKIKGTVKKFSVDHNFGSYDILKKDAPFNRGRALHDGIMRWNGIDNVLMFLCDIDIKFNQPFLERCRKYTEPGKTVYMPILFSLYNPNIVFGTDEVRLASKALNISGDTGTWRPLGYGMVCTYKNDYLRTHGFNLGIRGWGGEDVSLYHR